MTKRQGKMTLAQKQAASAAANQANLAKARQQTGASQPVAVETTVTITAETDSGILTAVETVPVPQEQAGAPAVTPNAAPVPVVEAATAPALVPSPVDITAPVAAQEQVVAPVTEPVSATVPVAVPEPAPVPAPVQSPTAGHQQQQSTQAAVYQPSEAFKKTHGFW